MIEQRRVRLLLAVFLGAAIAAAYLYHDRINVVALESWIEQAGILAPVIFIALYAAATVLFLPGSALTLLGGVLFGPVTGTLYNLSGATLGASIAFLLSRYVASDWVAEKAGGRTRQLINGVEHEGWRFVAFVRLVPLFPFNLLNYALGLTKIHFLHYFLATLVFMLPGAVAYTWLGYAGREAVSSQGGMINNILIAIALLAVMLFLPRLIGAIRRGPSIDVHDLSKRLQKGDTLVLDVRTPEEFTGYHGHIDGALNIAVEELADRLPELDDYLERPIAIVCRTDRRSARAAMILARAGFHDVHVVIGGMTKWAAAGMPVVAAAGGRPTAGG